MRPVADLSMCHSDFSVLLALLREGPQPVNTLGKQVCLTSGSITTSIDRLEQRGYVERKQDSKDRRVCLVTLTKSGRAIVEHASLRYSQAIDKTISILSAQECELLQNLLRKIAAEPVSEHQPGPTTVVKPSLEEVIPPNGENNHFEGFTGLD